MPGPDIKITETTFEDLIAHLDDPKSFLGRAKQHHIISDVGASNCRVGIVAKGNDGIHEILFASRPANSVVELRAVYQNFVDVITPRRLSKVVAASANLPAPAAGMIGGPIANYKGKELKDRFVDYTTMPVELFPRENTVVMNDLEACAHGIVATSMLDTFSEAFSLMWEAKKPHEGYKGSIGKGNCVVVAPGTGLGVAAIQYHHHDDKYTVFPLEFGHVNIPYVTPATFAPTGSSAAASSLASSSCPESLAKFVENPTSAEASAAFLNDYCMANYNGKNPSEYDDLCAGRGMERAYKFLTGGRGADLKAPAISKLASQGDKHALGAMRLYNKMIMNFCSQMAMGFQPKCIIICGDNAVKNSFYYTDEANVAEMKEEYLSHSIERLGFMSKIHLLRQTKRMNLNLLGCAYVCETMKKHKKSKL